MVTEHRAMDAGHRVSTVREHRAMDAGTPLMWGFVCLLFYFVFCFIEVTFYFACVLEKKKNN